LSVIDHNNDVSQGKTETVKLDVEQLWRGKRQCQSRWSRATLITRILPSNILHLQTDAATGPTITTALVAAAIDNKNVSLSKVSTGIPTETGAACLL
jgi:hypothetical protein